MSIDQDIAASSKTLEADVKINHDIVNGDENTEVPTEGGPVPSIRKRLKDIETEWAKTADPLADDLATTVQLTNDYKEQAATSVVGAATYATETANNTQLSRQYRDAAKDSEDQSAQSEQVVIAAETVTLDARDDTVAAQQQVETQIIPVHTDVIRTQQIIRSMNNGIHEDVGYAADSAAIAKHAQESTSDNAQQVATDTEVVVSNASNVSTMTANVEQTSQHIDQQKTSVDNSATQVSADAGQVASQKTSVDQSAQQTATDSATAVAAADESRAILDEIGSTLIGHVTNLITTQTIITANHAFN